MCIEIYGVIKTIPNLILKKDTSDSKNWKYPCKFEKVRFIEGPKAGSFTWMKIFRCPVYILKRSSPKIHDQVVSDEFYVSNGDELNTVFLYNKSPYNHLEFLVEGYVFGLDYARKVPKSKIWKKIRRRKRTHIEDDAKDTEFIVKQVNDINLLKEQGVNPIIVQV